MTYSVKEIFYTLQGEGAQTGRAAVFLRFAGCNLWTGREEDRAHATCKFCDTDFVGTDGPWRRQVRQRRCSRADAAASNGRRRAARRPIVVCTGGEPLLQIDAALIDALHARGFEIAIETNGTLIRRRSGIDWICVSPKAGADFVLKASGDELKLVYPQSEIEPSMFEGLDFRHFFLQPMDGRGQDRTTPGGDRLLPCPSAMAAEHPDA